VLEGCNHSHDSKKDNYYLQYRIYFFQHETDVEVLLHVHKRRAKITYELNAFLLP
jgi:hypothetical protein